MGDFNEKVRRQKRADGEAYLKSIKEINAVIERKKRDLHYGQSDKDNIVYVLNRILCFFNIPFIEVPMSIVDEEEKFIYTLNSANIMRRKIILHDKWWKKDALPILCIKKDTKEYVAFIPLKYGGYSYYSRERKQEIKVTKKEAENFEDEAYCFYKPFPEKSLTIKNLFVNMGRTLSFYDFAFLIGISLLVALMGLVVPLVNQFIFNRVIPSGTREDIGPVTILIIGVVLTTGFFDLLRSIWITRVGDKIKIYAESGMWNRVLNLPVGFFKQYEAGDLTQRMMMITSICNVFSGSTIPIILTTVFSFVYLVQIGAFSSSLVIPTILILGVMIGFAILNSMLQIKMNKEANHISSKLSGLVFQLFSGIRKIKLCGAEVRAFSQWTKLFAKQSKIAFSPNFIIQFSGAVNTAITLGGTVLIYIVVYQSQLSTSDFITFQVAFGSLSAAILQFSSIAAQIAFIKPAFEMVEPILKEEPESNRSKVKIQELRGKIDLSNVGFRYHKDMEFVLNHLSISIKEGEYVALVGSSGCGKSTLFRLLLGFEKPELGAVYYDDKELESLDIRSVRQRIGTVLQDGKLFAGDIYSNIVICAPWLTMEDAWEAARNAGLDKDIEDMPMGMYTMIPESGAGISGGQRQRLLIARALAMNPDILLFDEATSALDNITQAAIVKTLAQMKITRIVIAHRLSTIKQCDRILYLDQGNVVEEGTYDELMKLNKRFTGLAKRQLV